MSKVAVVYWNGTGNTAVMATAVAEGVQENLMWRWCREYGYFAQNDELAFPNTLVSMMKLR